MSNREEFDKDLYVRRENIERDITKWITTPTSKRVGVLEAPPGSGKSWLITFLATDEEQKRFYRSTMFVPSKELGAINAVNLRQRIADLQTRWVAKTINQLQDVLCPDPNPIYINFLETTDLIRRTQFLAELLCLCPELHPPVFFIDGYDEISEDILVDLRRYLVDPLLTHISCTKIVIGIRPGVLINGINLRDHLSYFEFDLTWKQDEAESARRQIEQITSSQEYLYPEKLLSRIRVSMQELNIKGILRLPFVTRFLYDRLLTKAEGTEDANESSTSLIHLLNKKDYLDCLFSLFQGAKIAKIEKHHLDSVGLIATHLGVTWSQTDFKNSEEIRKSEVIPPQVYLSRLNELKERGLVIYIGNPDKYQLVDGIREIVITWYTHPEKTHE